MKIPTKLNFCIINWIIINQEILLFLPKIFSIKSKNDFNTIPIHHTKIQWRKIFHHRFSIFSVVYPMINLICHGILFNSLTKTLCRFHRYFSQQQNCWKCLKLFFFQFHRNNKTKFKFHISQKAANKKWRRINNCLIVVTHVT